ncbi:MAG TPA: peptidoglycan-binding domain-containing protein [Aestuariivirgaceae bacterium]|nr:peptidoglycan-binding domain-containing protein [Aestuariivirgaceae bacterium]
MTDTAETNTLPPFRLAVAASTAVLCGVIIYNAVAGQDGRQRDVLSRLTDLEQHSSLPVTIGVGAFDGRPTTKSMVTLEQLAEIAANADERDVLAAEVGRELEAIGLYRTQADTNGALLRQAIEAYQRAHDMEVTGEPTARLLDHIRFTAEIGDAATVGVDDVDILTVQEGLARLGYSPGPLDGVLGAQTRDAIRRFEQDRNLTETGAITEELVREVTRVMSSAG